MWRVWDTLYAGLERLQEHRRTELIVVNVVFWLPIIACLIWAPGVIGFLVGLGLAALMAACVLAALGSLVSAVQGKPDRRNWRGPDDLSE